MFAFSCTNARQQIHYVEKALQVASRRSSVDDREWTCGIVLEDALGFLPQETLPLVAQYLVNCQTNSSLNDHYVEALCTMAGRIGDDMASLNVVWPLVAKLEDSKKSLFVKQITPKLDNHWIAKVFVFVLRSLDNDPYVVRDLRNRVREMPLANQLEIYNTVLQELSDLPRPKFVKLVSWLTPIMGNIATAKAQSQAAEAFLDVGAWWP